MSNTIIPVSSTENIDDLADVNITNVQINDTICWNGTNFVNVPKENQDHAIPDHTDVTVTNIQDGDVLCWDSASSMFVNVPKANQDHAIEDHTNVTITTVADGETLCYDSASGQWVNVPKENQDQSLDEHTDVTLTTPADNDTLCFDSASGQWVNVPKATGIPAHGITDHTDVDTTGVTDGQTLCYDSASGNWLPVDKQDLTHSVEDHDDVTITSLQDGQQLCWDATASMWVNVDKESSKCCVSDPGGFTVGSPIYIDATGAIAASDISNSNTVGQAIVVSTDGTELCFQSFGLCELDAAHGFTVGACYFEDAAGGITTTSPTSGINNALFHVVSATKLNVLAGTRPYEIGGTAAGQDLDDHVDVVITNPQVGDVLTFNGTNWVNQ